MITIERLSAKNIKNLALKETPFRRVTLVLGENGYGKTNLLRLIHCLLQPKTMPPELGQAKFPIEGELRNDGDLLRRGQAEATASLTVHGKGASYEEFQKAFLGPADKKTMSATVDFAIKEHKPGILVQVTAIRIGEKQVYPEAEGKKGTKDDAKKAELQAALEKWVRTDLAGKTTYIPTARLLKRNLVPYQVERPATAVDDLENTILRLYTSKAEDPKALDRIRKVLRDFFDIEDIRPHLLAPEEPPMVKGADGKFPPAPPPPLAEQLQVGIRVREGETEWYDLDHVGSGIQQVLAIVTMLEESKAKIALIEEFETSLSYKNRNKFLQQLTELAGNEKPLDQIITSSHAVFRPKQENVMPIGPDKAGQRDHVNFREWTEGKDWANHTKLDK